MKISFYRKGFASNSSSSHSLVWLSTIPTDNTNSEGRFGWDFFVCSDYESKKQYLFMCLYYSWKCSCDFKYDFDSYIDYLDVERFLSRSFDIWVRKRFPDLIPDNYTKIEEYDGDIDHQSILAFPSHRNTTKLNEAFVHKFVDTLLNNDNLVILGGNDNTNNSHPLSHNDVSTEFANMKFLFSILKERNPRVVMAEYDKNLREFVLSLSDTGDLIRISF